MLPTITSRQSVWVLNRLVLSLYIDHFDQWTPLLLNNHSLEKKRLSPYFFSLELSEKKRMSILAIDLSNKIHLSYQTN
jgi:hypothetical protein